MPSLKRKDDFVVYVVTLSNMKRYISIEFIGDMRVHHRSKGTAFRHLRYARRWRHPWLSGPCSNGRHLSRSLFPEEARTLFLLH